MNKLISSSLMWIFLWSGTKLFPFVDIYSPGSEDDPVQGIAFCASKETWDEMRKDEHELEMAHIEGMKEGHAIAKKAAKLKRRKE